MKKSQDKNSLFHDFPPVPTTEWIKKAEEDLKGIPFEKLTWKFTDKFEIKPFYREEDLKESEYLNAEPGYFPFVRTNKKFQNTWEIRQKITVTNIKEANLSALHALNYGANSLLFEFPGHAEITANNLNTLLNKIDPDKLFLHFYAPHNEEKIIPFLTEECNLKNISPDKIKGSVYYDPLGQLAVTGNYYVSEENDFNKCFRLVERTTRKLPDFKVIVINGNVFHNAGGSAIHELAFSLSSASEYLERLTEKGISVDQAAKNFQLIMPVGPWYFQEIAKFRAARILFANLIKAWNPLHLESTNIYIHATTSEWNQTVFDPYMNILRGTTEGMSAVLSGIDSLTILPFGKAFGRNTDPGERIARNTQNILKEEAYLDKVIDPSAGSYYIEKITDSLVEQAWKLFLETEQKGGFSASLKSGFIQKLIKETARKRDMNIATRREIIVGTNQYPDPSEKPNSYYDNTVESPYIPCSENFIAEPLKPYRGAMAFENLRMCVNKHKAGKPKVFLLSYGNPSWFTARAVFASGFFGCAGYVIIQPQAFKTVNEGVKSALKAGSSIIVLCSSDDQYPVIAPQVKKMTGDKAILVIAGFPKETANTLMSLGIKHFIHKNSNILEELKKFNKLLGIQ